MTPEQRTEVEAAVFRRLRDHLQRRTDVQNIDLMIWLTAARNRQVVSRSGRAGREARSMAARAGMRDALQRLEGEPPAPSDSRTARCA